ncbi:hypothetical protein [Cytobacillus praedii]|uniref:Uncharacterized protein n=1 Tax=Cytobacillus praedii TaxID=1742358 RepID=A0A4R1AX79_9BACI|nr:hypothetical protein [Cytobacillus praedii]TCJ02182.1 hypothetical protein E0Y62_20495 [Cytobacillus praedii]
MIDTKPAKLHEKNIKQYKKIFEKWDMWDFAYFDGKDYYFLTLYEQVLKGITGYLILDYKGNIVPFVQAKAPALSLIRFNTMIHGAMQEMVPQMRKSMTPYKEVVSLLSKYKTNLVSKHPNLESSVEKVIQYTTHALGNSMRIEGFINKLGHLQRFATREHGYFDDEILKAMKEESVKYNAMMYEYGLNEFDMMNDYQQIINALSEGSSTIPFTDRKKINELLKAAMQSNNGSLKRTMQEFDDGFKEVNVLLNPANLEQSFDEKMSKSGLKAFEEKIVPIIRNPS